MATHHGKDAVVHVGGANSGQATGCTVDTTHEIVEDKAWLLYTTDAAGDAVRGERGGRRTREKTKEGRVSRGKKSGVGVEQKGECR